MPLGSAIASVVSSGINALSQARTNAVNREQANYAFQQQMQAIQRQNEFNSPAQQVLRMKAAGLNPSLAYGADGAMVGNQADVPAYNAIPAEAPQVGNFGSAMNDAIRTGVEVKDLEIRQSLAMAEIALKDYQGYLAVTQGNLNEASASEIVSLLGYKIESYEAQNTLTWENVLQTREMISNIKAERNEIASRVKLNEAQISELAAREGLSETQAYAILARLPYELESMDAQAAMNWAQTEVGRETVKQIYRETQHIGFVERLEQSKFNFDLKSWKVEQEKWDAEMNQERRLHFIDGITHIIGLGIGASAFRKGQPLPQVSSGRAPITSSHHGTGSYSSHPIYPTNARGERLGRR